MIRPGAGVRWYSQLPRGEGHPVVDDHTGLMASEPHDGFARVPLTIENGRVMAHLGGLTGPIPGRPYGSPVFDSEPGGPYCVVH